MQDRCQVLTATLLRCRRWKKKKKTHTQCRSQRGTADTQSRAAAALYKHTSLYRRFLPNVIRRRRPRDGRSGLPIQRPPPTSAASPSRVLTCLENTVAMVTLFLPKQKRKSKVSFERSQTDGLHVNAVTLLENVSRLTVDVFIKNLGEKRKKQCLSSLCRLRVWNECGILTVRWWQASVYTGQNVNDSWNKQVLLFFFSVFLFLGCSTKLKASSFPIPPSPLPRCSPPAVTTQPLG